MQGDPIAVTDGCLPATPLQQQLQPKSIAAAQAAEFAKGTKKVNAAGAGQSLGKEGAGVGQAEGTGGSDDSQLPRLAQVPITYWGLWLGWLQRLRLLEGQLPDSFFMVLDDQPDESTSKQQQQQQQRLVQQRSPRHEGQCLPDAASLHALLGQCPTEPNTNGMCPAAAQQLQQLQQCCEVGGAAGASSNSTLLCLPPCQCCFQGQGVCPGVRSPEAPWCPADVSHQLTAMTSAQQSPACACNTYLQLQQQEQQGQQQHQAGDGLWSIRVRVPMHRRRLAGGRAAAAAVPSNADWLGSLLRWWWGGSGPSGTGTSRITLPSLQRWGLGSPAAGLLVRVELLWLLDKAYVGLTLLLLLPLLLGALVVATGKALDALLLRSERCERRRQHALWRQQQQRHLQGPGLGSGQGLQLEGWQGVGWEALEGLLRGPSEEQDAAADSLGDGVDYGGATSAGVET